MTTTRNRICLLATLLCCTYHIGGRFTKPTNYYGDTIQQNANGTWCYFPIAGDVRATTCSGDFAMVSLVHLNTTTSIGYYGPDTRRYGGPEWPVPAASDEKVTLCASGGVQDGTYRTICMFVTADNSLPESGGCNIAVEQKTVTDGCYNPSRIVTPIPSSSIEVSAPTATSSPPSPSPPQSTSSLISSESSHIVTDSSTSTSSTSSTSPLFDTSTTRTSTTLGGPTTPTVSPGSQSSGGRRLPLSNTLAIVFGVISSIGVAIAIIRFSKSCNSARIAAAPAHNIAGNGPRAENLILL